MKRLNGISAKILFICAALTGGLAMAGCGDSTTPSNNDAGTSPADSGTTGPADMGTASTSEAEPNNDDTTANPLTTSVTGNVNGTTDAQDQPAGPDPIDVFAFTPPRDGNFTFTLTWTGDSDLDVAVTDAAGDPLNTDGVTDGNPETTTVSLTNGDRVFVVVIGYETSGSAVSYALSVQ